MAPGFCEAVMKIIHILRNYKNRNTRRYYGFY